MTKIYIKSPGLVTAFVSREQAERMGISEFETDLPSVLPNALIFVEDEDGNKFLSASSDDAVDWADGRDGVTLRMIPLVHNR